MNIQEEILKSIEVMIDKSLNKYNSTRTEAAIVESIKNGKYQVTVNGTKCYVYDSVGCNPKVGNAVWVQIPNGSLTNAFITGRKNKSVDGLFNENNNNNNGGSGGNSSGTNSSTSSTGGSGTITTGTTDYNNLENKPQINGVDLEGNLYGWELQLNYSDLLNPPSINGYEMSGDITISAEDIAPVGDNSDAFDNLAQQVSDLYYELEEISVPDYNDLDNKPTYKNEPIVGELIINSDDIPYSDDQSVKEAIEDLYSSQPIDIDSNCYKLRLSKIQYTEFENEYWGSTNEEKARNIAKFDIHVSGGINNTTLPIIRRAKEINPNVKICYYISVASGRPWYDEGWYTFRRGGIWDTEWASEQSIAHNNTMTRPSNKWEILQEIEKAHHVGGQATGNRIFIENYTWEDEDGVSHTEAKYIDEYTGGESYDGFFWDDVGFDNNITSGLFYDSDNSTSAIESIKRQGFKSRRDKYICINKFARDRGMFVIPNSINKDDLYDPAVSDSNPDGLGSSLTENDFVFIESCLTMVGDANSVKWRNEIPKAIDYLDNWYSTVKAKVICEDYIYGGMDEKTRDYLITYMMSTYSSIGVHYFALTDVDTSRPSLDMYIPDILNLPVPLDNTIRKTHLTVPSQNVYKYDFAGNTLSVTRNTTITNGNVDSYSILNGTKIIFNNNHIINAFLSAPEAHSELFDELEKITNEVNESLIDTKRNASIYNRLMIDDWSVTTLEYTNIFSSTLFREWAEGSKSKNSSKGANTTYNVESRTLHWELASLDNSYQTEYCNIELGSEYSGHVLEIGFKLTTQGEGVGAWINFYVGGNFIFDAGANPLEGSSTIYPERTDMFIKRITLPTFGNTTTLQILGSWNNNATSATFESFYVIDTEEFEEDITKTEYTNYLPNPSSYSGYVNPHVISLTKTDNRNFTVNMLASKAVEGEEDAVYSEGNGPSWWINAAEILTPGHTYEIGIEDYEVTNGTISFNFGINSDSGVLCGDIPIQRKITSQVCASKTYNKIFNIPEDAVLGSSLLCIRYFLSQGETDPGDFTIHNWYLYDIDEEGVVIRGLTPSNTSLRIARVKDENLESDITNNSLLNNTLYITDSGKTYITDINKEITNLSSDSDDNVIVNYGTTTEFEAQKDSASVGEMFLITDDEEEVTEIDLTEYAKKTDIPTIPTDLKDFNEDTTHRLVTDTEKSTWNNKANTSAIPTQLSQLTEDSTHRLVTDAEKTQWNNNSGGSTVSVTQKQTSGTEIATITVDGTATKLYAPISSSSGGSSSGGDGSSINVWHGTLEEYEEQKDTIAEGTLLAIDDDDMAIGDLNDFFDILNGGAEELVSNMVYPLSSEPIIIGKVGNYDLYRKWTNTTTTQFENDIIVVNVQGSGYYIPSIDGGGQRPLSFYADGTYWNSSWTFLQSTKQFIITLGRNFAGIKNCWIDYYIEEVGEEDVNS